MMNSNQTNYNFITTNFINNYSYTDSTTSTNVWTTTIQTYQPFDSNLQFVYDDCINWHYQSNDYGLREYMFANDLYVEISDILIDNYYRSDNDQEFEDNLYRFTLDLLYDYIKQEATFKDFFNEKLFKYREVNKIIQEIINRYHTIIAEEC